MRSVKSKIIHIALLIAAFVSFTPMIGGADARNDSRSSELNQLRDQILTTFEKSVTACSVFQQGSSDCVKRHFQKTYAWYVLGEKDFRVGPPGTPGPFSRQ